MMSKVSKIRINNFTHLSYKQIGAVIDSYRNSDVMETFYIGKEHVLKFSMGGKKHTLTVVYYENFVKYVFREVEKW